MDRCNQGSPKGDASLKKEGNGDEYEWERDRNFKSILTTQFKSCHEKVV